MSDPDGKTKEVDETEDFDEMLNKLPDEVAELSAKDRKVLMPQWTSTQPTDRAYMIGVEGLDPAPILGQRVVAARPNGVEPTEVSTTHLPYEYWITTAGNIVQIPVKTNRVSNRGKSVDQSMYGSQTTQHMIRKGWLRYDTGHPEETTERWLARREGEIKKRRARQKRRSDEADRELREKQAQQAEYFKEAFISAMKSFEDGEKDRQRRANQRAATKRR